MFRIDFLPSGRANRKSSSKASRLSTKPSDEWTRLELSPARCRELNPQSKQTNPGIFLSTAGQRLHFRKMSPSIKPGRRDDRPLPVIGMFKCDVADDRYVVFETGAVRRIPNLLCNGRRPQLRSSRWMPDSQGRRRY
jgi:hypothetical protein